MCLLLCMHLPFSNLFGLEQLQSLHFISLETSPFIIILCVAALRSSLTFSKHFQAILTLIHGRLHLISDVLVAKACSNCSSIGRNKSRDKLHVDLSSF